MRLLIVFAIFLTTKYALQTFLQAYKYHEEGFFSEFLPFLVLVLLCSLLYKKALGTKKFIWIYLKLILTSIAGYLTAEVILFYQWYWVTHPEYRNIPGDMSEGLGFTIIFSIVWSIALILTYLVILLSLKSIERQKVNSEQITK